MKRKMMAIVAASLMIMMTMCGALAYAEQGDGACDPTPVVEVPKEEKPAPTPAAETPEPEETEKPTPVPEEEKPAPEETPDPEETPNPEETPDPEDDTQEQVKAFEGSVSVRIMGKGEIAYGDQVTLVATVKGADGIEYTLRWEVDNGNGWQTVENENGSTYTFTLTEQNAGYQWRAVVITEA